MPERVDFERDIPSSDTHFKLIRLIEAEPGMSQRELAHRLGISLGKVNYCLQAVLGKGWIKAINFKNSRNKSAYMYQLTPRGIEVKARLTLRFLQIKMREYELLRREIDEMHRELERMAPRRSAGARMRSSKDVDLSD